MHQNHRKQPATKGKALDKYYTRKGVVRRCLEKVEELGHVYDLAIEPSAGNGAFYDEIKHGNKIGIDIDPCHRKVAKADWLDYNVANVYKKVLVVGNPPFGRYHRLSTAFIERALSFPNVQTIAFILPDVYNKHTRQKVLPLHWRICSITALGRDAFVLDGEDYHVPTSFFVFDKSVGKDLRANPHLYRDTDDFEFGDENDFDVFVFGASPKRVTLHPKPNNRGYFLKSKIPVPDLITRIKGVDWTGNSCASGGVYWLTKHEFLEQYINRHGYSGGNTLYSEQYKQHQDGGAESVQHQK